MSTSGCRRRRCRSGCSSVSASSSPARSSLPATARTRLSSPCPCDAMRWCEGLRQPGRRPSPTRNSTHLVAPSGGSRLFPAGVGGRVWPEVPPNGTAGGRRDEGLASETELRPRHPRLGAEAAGLAPPPHALFSCRRRGAGGGAHHGAGLSTRRALTLAAPLGAASGACSRAKAFRTAFPPLAWETGVAGVPPNGTADAGARAAVRRTTVRAAGRARVAACQPRGAPRQFLRSRCGSPCCRLRAGEFNL
jgi:hypothetical protein